jgi:glucose-1-phosphate adenylyltransferase
MPDLTGLDRIPRRRASDDMSRHTFALVLAGGRGSRLGELTDDCAKPAMPFAGHLRIIDFTLSNCVNADLKRVAVLTQYKAQSLIRHLARTWGFLDADRGEFIEAVPAQQRIDTSWYAGTADAVRQNLDLVRAAAPRHVLVLAGDHIYKMDYRRLLEDHVRRGADATVACTQVPASQCRPFGIVHQDDKGRVTGFDEKPDFPESLAGDTATLWASMGIYVFDAAFLYRELALDAADGNSGHDFGHDLLPRMLRRGRVYAHDFAHSCVVPSGSAPYWRDVGTLDAYWSANMDVVRTQDGLNLFDHGWPIRGASSALPPAWMAADGASVAIASGGTLLSPGCVLQGASVRGSVMFPQTRLGQGTDVEDTLVMPQAQIGRQVRLRRVIVAEGCVIPDGMAIGFDPARDRQHFRVTDGGVTLVTPPMLARQARLAAPCAVAA